MADFQRNPKDSMKSTWRQAPHGEWTVHHKILDLLNIHPSILGREPPVYSKQDKVPHLPNWQMIRWVLFYAFLPMALHQAYVHFTGHNLHVVTTYFFYHLALLVTSVHQIRLLRRMGYIYGFLDGDKHPRDEVPDAGVKKAVISLVSTIVVRSILFIILAYRSNQPPATINWKWLPLEIGVYSVVLDFWFYWYHRLMHETDSLWKLHRTHHLTKHPNPLLTAYADTVQEVFDIAGIPLLTFGTMKALGMPMGFYDYWVCHSFVIFTEIIGHSGLRIHLEPPSTATWLLKALGLELVLEDHDLHHRSGWRKSHNYGKQTRVWDRMFGTCGQRVECHDDNVDYTNTASMPMF